MRQSNSNQPDNKDELIIRDIIGLIKKLNVDDLPDDFDFSISVRGKRLNGLSIREVAREKNCLKKIRLRI